MNPRRKIACAALGALLLCGIALAQSSLTITTQSLPAGSLCSLYSLQLAATGGVPPYRWYPPEVLPPGITFSTGGLVSGTPTTPGSYSFPVSVYDAQNAHQSKSFVLVVTGSTASITTEALPNGNVGSPYSQQLTATGTGTAQWTLVSGILPAGLSLGASGTITGTPSAAGTATFTVRVTYGNGSTGCTASRQFSITIAAPALRITTTALPDGSLCALYSNQLQATGGTPPYQWSLFGGVGPIAAPPPGITLSSTGLLSGYSSSTGSWSFAVLVLDAQSARASAALTLRITGGSITISPATLPDGTANTAYSQQLTATGLENPQYSLISGNFPPGLTLSASGRISGTPTVAGTYTFTVQVAIPGVTDACSGTRQYTLVINSPIQPLKITTSSLPEASLCAIYSQVMAAQGGTTPYIWSLGDNSPSWLGINSASGLVTGTPPSAGTWTISITVRDSRQATDTRSFSVTVRGSPATIATASLPGGTVSTPYSYQLAATGSGTPQWSVAGSLPNGLSINSAGSITGTPTTPGTFSFTVSVTYGTGGSGCAASKQLSITIQAAVPDLVITTSSLPNGTVGVAYSQTLSATGGTPPYTWSATGSLPAGITLNPGSGVLSGIPTAQGSFDFTIRVADNAQRTATKGLSVTIGAGLTITTTSPLPGGTVGVAYSQTLRATNGYPPLSFSVTGSLPSGIVLQQPTLENQYSAVLSGTPTEEGSFDFSVKVKDRMQATAEKAFTITIAGPALTISTESFADGMVGFRYSSQAQAAGGKPGYAWSLLSGSLPAGLTLSPEGVISGKPTASGTAAFTLQAADARGDTTSKALSIKIAAGPSVTFSGLPDTVDPAQQPGFEVKMGAPLPVALTGRLTLAFAHNCVNGADDKTIVFANNQRTIDFTVAANSTQAMFGATPAVQLASTGTTAGTITVTASLQSSSEDVTPSPSPVRSVTVKQLAPAISSVTAARTAGGVEVSIIGYSTTRHITSATFRFTASQADLPTAEFTVPVETAFTTWYTNTASPAFGSEFRYVQPFTVQGDSTRLTSVTVTLSNAVGASPAKAVNF
jgi:hypothetical protein